MVILGVGIGVFYLLGMFVLVQAKKDPSIGNFTWGGGVSLLTLYTLFARGLFLPRQLLVTGLTLLWCGRLVYLLYARYQKGADPRFVAWEQRVGWYATLFNFVWIVILNGLMMAVMAVPSVLINAPSIHPVGHFRPSQLALADTAGWTGGVGLRWLDWLGALIWCGGFVCEAVADHQLFVFLRNPENKGKVMTSGLWYYSRHPNYFGEIVMWWGIFLIALSAPYGYLAIISPVTITILLRYVTGVPWVEKVFDDNPAYQEYKKRTSVIVPWYPSNSAG